METITVNESESNVEILLTNTTLIVEEILNNLDNPELLKCKLVCSFWRKIADKIMSRRIIIIYRNIPDKLTRMAIAKPENVVCLDSLCHKNFQFLTEFSLKYAMARILEKLEQLNSEECGQALLGSIFNVRTRIAIFPSLPGIKVERFLFNKEVTKLSIEERIRHLTKLINVPKHELKCVLWFANQIFDNYPKTFPDLQVPSLLLSPLLRIRFESTENCGIAFSGGRMNVVILKIEESSYTGIESKFQKEIQKIKDYKLEPFKCVALMFGNWNCSAAIQNIILCLFKETFPNLPVLLFWDKFLFDIPMSIPDDECKNGNYECLANNNNVIRIVLIWLN